MATDTKRLGTDLTELLAKFGPTTLRAELAKLIEAQQLDGYVHCDHLQALLDRFPERPATSGFPPIRDRAHAKRALQGLALWGHVPLDREIPAAIEQAENFRHPASSTGSLRSYIRLQEVIDALGGV